MQMVSCSLLLISVYWSLSNQRFFAIFHSVTFVKLFLFNLFFFLQKSGGAKAPPSPSLYAVPAPPNQHLRPLYSLLFFTPYMLLRHLITSYRVINKSVTIFHGLYFIWLIREQTEKNCFLFVFYNNIDNHFR